MPPLNTYPLEHAAGPTHDVPLGVVPVGHVKGKLVCETHCSTAASK